MIGYEYHFVDVYKINKYKQTVILMKKLKFHHNSFLKKMSKKFEKKDWLRLKIAALILRKFVKEWNFSFLIKFGEMKKVKSARYA